MPKITVEKMTIDGKAVSGVASALSLVELGVCLDIGNTTKAALKCGVVLVTHGHIDHLGAIVQHANIRSMMGGQKSTYIVPSHLVAPIANLFAAWAALQQGETPNYEIITVDPGQEIHLPGQKGWTVRPFATPHRIPSQGYMLVETRQKLRADMEGKSPAEIGNLRRQGIEVTEKKEVIRFAYTGDTRVEVLDMVPELQTCEVLIMESTFVGADHDEEFASKRGHVHLNGILKRLAGFQNKAVVLVHFSARYEKDTIATEVAKVAEQTTVPFHAFI